MEEEEGRFVASIMLYFRRSIPTVKHGALYHVLIQHSIPSIPSIGSGAFR